MHKQYSFKKCNKTVILNSVAKIKSMTLQFFKMEIYILICAIYKINTFIASLKLNTYFYLKL